MTTVTELLSRARHAIEAGENSLHDAAEDIAAAQEQGATQRRIAEAVGKSAPGHVLLFVVVVTKVTTEGGSL